MMAVFSSSEAAGSAIYACHVTVLCDSPTERPGRDLVTAMAMSEPLQHSNVTEVILSGFYEVFNVLGSGFVEAVYIAALVIVLRRKGLQVEEKPSLPVYFNGRILGRFTPDLLVNGVVIVEAKAVRAIDGAHKAQVINYLKASSIEVGLLLNFGDTPQFQRLVFDNARKAARKPPHEISEVDQNGGSDTPTSSD
jgi:GxxExxY protein